MTETLKPCPFCNSELEEPRLVTYYDFYNVSCGDVGCRGWVDDDGRGVRWYPTIQDAIAAWNTRAERTCHDAKPNLSYFFCDSCDMGDGLWIKDGFYRDVKPNYCPHCGAKVVE